MPWDGYLKYFRPSEREKRARQKIFSQILKHRFGLDQGSHSAGETPDKKSGAN